MAEEKVDEFPQKVLFDFSPQGDTELEISEGETVIKVVIEGDDDTLWSLIYKPSNPDVQGYVPSSFLGPIEEAKTDIPVPPEGGRALQNIADVDNVSVAAQSVSVASTARSKPLPSVPGNPLAAPAPPSKPSSHTSMRMSSAKPLPSVPITSVESVGESSASEANSSRFTMSQLGSHLRTSSNDLGSTIERRSRNAGPSVMGARESKPLLPAQPVGSASNVPSTAGSFGGLSPKSPSKKEQTPVFLQSAARAVEELRMPSESRLQQSSRMSSASMKSSRSTTTQFRSRTMDTSAYELHQAVLSPTVRETTSLSYGSNMVMSEREAFLDILNSFRARRAQYENEQEEVHRDINSRITKATGRIFESKERNKSLEAELRDIGTAIDRERFLWKQELTSHFQEFR